MNTWMLISHLASRMKPSKYKFLKSHIFLIFLLLFSITARFWFFWQPSFSGDEAAHMSKAVSVARGVVDLVTFSNVQTAFKNTFFTIWEHNHAPLEFLILIPATVLEPREFWARFIHVFVNILTLISGYIFLKKVRGQRTALAFAVFFGTSIFVIWWSQIAMYLNL